LIQRRAPLISAPIANVMATPMIATRKPISATRRIIRGGNRETPSMIARASGTMTRCRSAKCNGV